ncbi:hypothetical protein JXI42_01710 [bacterium]|nr:hypothetical protein [bacterium]
MKKLIFLFCLIVFLNFVSAETITWTGSGGDNDWSNPGNWDPPRVPSFLDDVTIPGGSTVQLLDGRHVLINSMVNNGDVEVEAPDYRVVSFETREDFENNGEFTNNTELHWRGRDFTNNGNFRTNGPLRLFCRNFRNNPAARTVIVNILWFSVPVNLDQVEIVAREQAINFGELWGENSEIENVPGSDIRIECHEFQNFNLVKTGDGGRNADGGDFTVLADIVRNFATIEAGEGGNLGNGGDIEAYGKWLVENYGKIFGGNGGYGGGGGHIRFISNYIDNQGTIRGGEDGKKGAASPLTLFAEIILTGDTINIHPEDSLIYANMFFTATGKNITVYDINRASGLYADARVNFNTAVGGILDFSGVTVPNAIGVDYGDIWLRSDSIIAPPAGFATIMSIPPLIVGSDTTIIGGYIGINSAIADTGDTDTLELKVKNLSTANKTLVYSVNSALGWVIPATGMFFGVAPFALESLNVIFNIPPDAYEGQTDTVIAILSIDPEFAETTYSLITVSNGVIHFIDAFLVEPVDLNADGKVISACDSQCIHWHLDLPEDCVVENVEASIGSTMYDLRSPELSLLGDDVILCPALTTPWLEGDSVEFCLASVLGTMGAFLPDPVCGRVNFDFSPPVIDSLQPPPGTTVPDTGAWISFSLSGSICWPVSYDAWVNFPGGLDEDIPYVPYFFRDLIPGDTVLVCVEVTEGCIADYCTSAIRSDTCWTFYVEAPLFTFEYDIPMGWNLLSYPYADEVLLSETFEFFTPPGYGYDVPGRAYFPIDTVTAGWGFWLMSPFDTTATATSSTELDTIHYTFYPGWNIFGPPSITVPSSFFDAFPEVLGPPFGYDALLRSYFIADELYPGFGYWILSLDTLEFALPE